MRRPALPTTHTHPKPDLRKQRSDGLEARTRLLHAALKLFAEKGFAKTSTREIALAAGANIAAIAYYFGDKTGLYRATFTEPMGSSPRDAVARFSPPELTLREALSHFFGAYLEPLKQGELAQLCMRLHLREMLEPTSQWAVELEQDIKRPHLALVALLCRHLGLARADDGVHRLAFAIAGLAMHLFAGREILQAIRPSLVQTPQSIDRWTPQLVEFALAMVTAEATLRSPATAVPRKRKEKSA